MAKTAAEAHGCRRRTARGPGGLRPAPGEHADHRRHVPGPQAAGEVVVARDIARQGNTSAASIPLAIEALLESGEAKSGQTCLIIGFGAGLVYAGQVIVLP